MSKYFSISGYYKDNHNEFDGYIVKEFDDVEEDENLDDMIFFYGLSEENLIEAIELGENTMHDFVITEYHETTLC